MNLLPLCIFLKKHTNTQFKTLLDIVVVDYPLRKERFEVIYIFLSISRNTRLLVKSQLSVLSSIPSLTQHYSAAG
jgi:NADH:ubiquinone oxidoreductase subunit C